MNASEMSSTHTIPELLLEVVPRLMQVISSNAQAGGPTGALTTSQLRVLSAVVRGRRLASEVARELRITPATTSELVDVLARRGLVERRDDPEDRRVSVLFATEAGIAAWRAGQDRSLSALESLVSRLDPEESRALEMGLEAVLRLLTPATAAEGRGR